MKCPFCSGKTRIYNSRRIEGGSQTWRRHRCEVCQRVFTTRERIDWDGRTSVRTENGSAPYNRERLLLSLLRASHNLQFPTGTLTLLCDQIEHVLEQKHFFEEKTQPSLQIVEAALVVLHRYDANLALQYINAVYQHKPPLELLQRIVARPNQ